MTKGQKDEKTKCQNVEMSKYPGNPKTCHPDAKRRDSMANPQSSLSTFLVRHWDADFRKFRAILNKFLCV